MASTQNQGQVRVTVHCQDNFAFKADTDSTPDDRKATPTDQGHVNEALEDDDILSPHKIDLTELNMESKLQDIISLIMNSISFSTFYVGCYCMKSFLHFKEMVIHCLSHL